MPVRKSLALHLCPLFKGEKPFADTYVGLGPFFQEADKSINLCNSRVHSFAEIGYFIIDSSPDG